MLGIFNFFKRNKEKKIRQERVQNKKLERTERNVVKTTAIQKQALSILDLTNANHQDLQEKIKKFNDEVAEFQKKIEENQRIQEQLQEKENMLNKWEADLKDRKEENGKEEMKLHIRQEAAKQEEKRLNKKDRDLDHERENIAEERKNIKEREKKTDKALQKAEESKEKYDTLQKEADENKRQYKEKIKDLETREKHCRETESSIETRLQQVKEKEEAFINKEAELLKSFQERQDRWEEERKEIEHNLNEKIKEYDRKMADIEAMGETIDNIKFDDSEDGKQAKIAVKEALRASMQTLEGTLHKFRELDEKYASGTFKGFSVPIDEISNTNEELKSYYENIRENAEASGFDFSVWLKKIEDCIIEADKQYKSHLFAESYRACIMGVGYCDGYADMVNMFNSYAGGDETYAEDEDSSWYNYYEFFFEEDYNDEMDYTSVRFGELKKQYRKMAKKYHPDTAPEDEKGKYEEMMKKLNEIWEILKDEQRRKEYDNTYHEEKGKNNG